MIQNPQQQTLEAKLRALIQGFRKFHPAITPLVIRGEQLIPAQVVQHLHRMVETFETVRDLDARHRAAVEIRNRATPEYRAFYEDAVSVVRAHCGSDAVKLAGFGLDCPGRSGRKPKTGSRTPQPEEACTQPKETCPQPEEPCGGQEETVEVIEVIEVITESPTACPRPTRVDPRGKCRKPKGTRAKAKGGRC